MLKWQRSPNKKALLGIQAKSRITSNSLKEFDSSGKTEELGKESRLNELKIDIIKMQSTKKGIVLTTKSSEDNRLLEETVKDNTELKDK